LNLAQKGALYLPPNLDNASSMEDAMDILLESDIRYDDDE
jgi:hypothetical protein